MKNKRLDEYTVHLIILVVFTGGLLLLERILSESVEGFFYALVPTLLVVLFYILFHRRVTTFEDSIKELLETHIPDIVYFDNSVTTEAELITAVNGAEKYIMTTGGKSKIGKYLAAIERNLEENDIEYYRIIFGKKISNELYEHLSKIIENRGVYVSYTPQELTPTLLLTEKVAFLGLPDPEPEEFKTCLKIPDERIREKLEKYIRSWRETSERLSNKEDLGKIRMR
jgi:hypothetical protein